MKMYSSRKHRLRRDCIWTFACYVFVNVAMGASFADQNRCNRLSIAGCSVGMSFDEVCALLPAAQVDRKADGTRLLRAGVANPIPSVDLGQGALEVTIDKDGFATEVWFQMATDRTEVDILNAVKQAWGTLVTVRGSDLVGRSGSRDYLMNATWSTRCGAEPRLNVSIMGDPSVTTVYLGLVTRAAAQPGRQALRDPRGL